MQSPSKVFFCALTATIAAIGACASHDDDREDLDPSGTYFVEWRAADAATFASAQRAVEGITDVRDFAALESGGLLEVGRMVPLGRDDRAIRPDDAADPTAVIDPTFCQGFPVLRTLSGVTSTVMTMSGAAPGYDVRYTPACSSYPCTRTVRSTPASRQQVLTFFYWRKPATSFNYWTMQTAGTGGGWSVALYSGSSSVSYKLRTCSVGGPLETTVTHSFQ